MKKKGIQISLFFLLLTYFNVGIHAEKNLKELPLKYQKWLKEEIVYIITPKEKEVFLSLRTSKERDLFIESFWKQRDPTPGTPENEFKREHEKRIAYANCYFGRASKNQGWQTDRGRIYIILGPPSTTESFTQETSGVVPIEIWFYQGNYGYGLPSAFYVVFFKEWGMGDFKLYSPRRHGPRKLLEVFNTDEQQALQLLRRISSELKDISLSLIPGEGSTFNIRSSLNSEILLHKISEFPKKKVKDSYAEKLLKYKNMVIVDHSVNYVYNQAIVKIMRNAQGDFFVHYAIEPERLSIGSDQEKYLINLEVYGKVDDLEGNTVYQFQKPVFFNVNSHQVSEIKSKRFCFQDFFPLIQGNFKFDLLIKNPVSKEFTSMEEDINIPESLSFPWMSPLTLAMKSEQISSMTSSRQPFQFGSLRLYPSVNKIFTQKDELIIYFNIHGLTSDLKSQGIIEYSFIKDEKEIHCLNKKINEYQDDENFLIKFPLKDFLPGIYRIKVSILGKNRQTILFEEDDFMISHVSDLPSSWTLFEASPPQEDEWDSYILGTQWLNTGEIEKSIILLERAYSAQPDSLEIVLSLCQAYYSNENFQKVVKILSRFLEKAKEENQIFILLGRSCEKLLDFKRAIYFYKKYLLHFGTNLEILNALGENYFRIKNFEEAIETWEKSLEIEPNQPLIKAKLAESKKNRKKD